jgi:nitrite reductase (NADH) small subunit
MTVMLDQELLRVCSTADVPLGEGRAVSVGVRRVAVFHTASGWYALDDACPHRGGPLSDGILADSCVACPLHDRRFSLAEGAALTKGASVESHRVIVRGGDVHVAIASSLERAA